jgi:hypothetical protein
LSAILKSSIVALALCAIAFAQVNISGPVNLTGVVTVNSSGSLPPPGIGRPQLPLSWVNVHESDGPYAVTKYIGNTVGGCPGNGGTCDYVCTNFSCLTQVITDHCAAPSQKWLAIVHAGTTFTDAGPLLLQACTVKQTAALVFTSDSPLTAGKIPCVGGIQDNIAGATDVYTRNQGCASGTDLSHMWSLTYTLNSNNSGQTNGIAVGALDGSGNGPSWYVFSNMHVFSSVAGAHVSNPIQLNPNTRCSALPCFASHIGFSQIYISGDATDAGGVGIHQIGQYITMDGAFVWLEHSNADGGIWPGTESHQVLIGQAPGPVKIVHNVMEGQSSSVFVGGLNVNPMPIAGVSDIEIRRNRFTYPAAWLGNGGVGGKCGSQNCVRKNAMEMKGCVRCLIAGNILENVDNSGSQNGPGINFNVRACSAGTGCDDYSQTIADLTMTENIIRNICRGVAWDGGSGNPLAGISVALPMQRVLFQNGLVYNNGLTQPGCSSASTSVGMKADASQHVFSGVTVTRNAGGTQSTVQTYLGSTKTISTISMTSNVVTVNLASALPQAPIGGSTWVDIEGVPIGGYNGVNQVCTTPTAGCIVPTTTSFTFQQTGSLASSSGGTAESFVGESQTGVTTGDYVQVGNCVDTTFNAGPFPPVLASNSVPTGTTISYPNTGTPNASTTCDYTTNIGFPRYLIFNHNTVVGDLLSCAPGNGSLSTQAAFSSFATITNNIFMGCGFRADGAIVEGTTSESGWWDTTTLTYHHNVQADRGSTTWLANTPYRIGDRVIPTGNPVRTYVAVTSGTSGSSQPTFTNTANSCITDNTVVWQNVNFQFPGAAGYTEYDTPGSGSSPATTIFFPYSSYCYTASATSACVGFSGGLSVPTSGANSCSSGTQVPSNSIEPIYNLATWTQYGLATTSVFRSAGSDGQDIGMNAAAISAAQTATQYVCQTSCGGGTFPD